MGKRISIRLLIGTAGIIAIAAPSCIPASAPTAAGTFIACYKEAGGAVRFVNEGETCDQGERQATWNQTGPQGPAGAPGKDGTGPVYRAAGISPVITPPSTATIVRSMTLPAGSYKIDFSGYVTRTAGTGDAQLSCFIDPSSTTTGGIGNASSSGLWDIAAIGYSTVTQFAAPTVVRTYCYPIPSGAISVTYSVSQPEMLATKITEIITP